MKLCLLRRNKLISDYRIKRVLIEQKWRESRLISDHMQSQYYKAQFELINELIEALK